MTSFADRADAHDGLAVGLVAAELQDRGYQPEIREATEGAPDIWVAGHWVEVKTRPGTTGRTAIALNAVKRYEHEQQNGRPVHVVSVLAVDPGDVDQWLVFSMKTLLGQPVQKGTDNGSGYPFILVNDEQGRDFGQVYPTKHPAGHDIAITFFGICATGGVPFGDAVAAAQVINNAAATFGPQADHFWDAVNAALCGDFAHLARLGVDMNISEALKFTPIGRRTEYRLLAIRKHISPLVHEYDPWRSLG